jgi:beta-galactosidase/beta-glucuronidase
MSDEIEILVGDVNDVEGHVLARLKPASGQRERGEPVVLQGTLRGPYCETARTLPAEFAFRELGAKESGLAEAIVPDPCVWSPELPHLYEVLIEARQGDRVVASYHGMIGLRRTPPKSETIQ